MIGAEGEGIVLTVTNLLYFATLINLLVLRDTVRSQLTSFAGFATSAVQIPYPLARTNEKSPCGLLSVQAGGVG